MCGVFDYVCGILCALSLRTLICVCMYGCICMSVFVHVCVIVSLGNVCVCAGLLFMHNVFSCVYFFGVLCVLLVYV